MRKLMRGVVALLVGGSVLTLGPSVVAGCHSFSVSAPDSVSEGNKVPVKVSRDAAVNPSSVRLTTVDGKAKSPGDFTAVDQRVQFTNETSRVVMVQTTNDAVTEGSEGFAVRVSAGEGCTVNPNFQYGAPEAISIKDDDKAPATSSPTAALTATAAATETPSPAATDVASPTLSPIGSAAALPVEEEDDGFPWLPLGIGAGIIAAGAGALILTRMRRQT